MADIKLPPNTRIINQVGGEDKVISTLTGEVVGHINAKENKFVQTIDILPRIKRKGLSKTNPNATLTSGGLTEQIRYLESRKETETKNVEGYKVGSDEYKAALSAIEDIDSQIVKAKEQLDKAKTKEGKTKKIEEKVTESKADAGTLAELEVQRQRLADLKQPTSAVDAKIADLKAKQSVKPKPVNQGTPMRPVGPVKVTPSKVVTPKGGKGSSNTSGTSNTGTGNTGSSGAGNTSSTTTKPVGTQSDFLAKYGVQLALINSDPGLKALLKQAMDGNWDANKWKLEFTNSAWAQTHAADWQLSETERLTAPATYAARWNRMRETLARLAVQAGVAISPEQLGVELKADGSSVSRGDGTITQWWMDQKSNQLTDEAITAHLASVGKMNLALPGGKAAGDVMALKEYAGQMGLSNLALPPSGDPSAMGSDWFTASAMSNLLGKTTLETQKAYILQQAKGMFSAFAPALDSGQTVKNIAAPYINTLANLLEIPTDQIDLGATTGYGKMVRDALIGMDPANQKPMALYDFEKQIKGRSEWGKTNNARDTIMGGVNDLLKSFGKVSG